MFNGSFACPARLEEGRGVYLLWLSPVPQHGFLQHALFWFSWGLNGQKALKSLMVMGCGLASFCDHGVAGAAVAF
jgi:hypothetical protein